MSLQNPKGNDLRKSGLEIIGDIPWGTHFCQFYQTKEDLADILVPYFKAGLESNEFCMWVTSEPLGVDDAKKWLIKMLPDMEHYISKGQLEIIPHTEWYYRGGRFDSDRVLKGWVEKHDKALEKGYAGLRLTGNTFWLEKALWQDFAEYEMVVDRVINNYRMIALCSYALDLCNAYEVIQVVSSHQFALIKESGEWKLIESSERKLMTEELRKSKEELEALVGKRTEELAASNKRLLAEITEKEHIAKELSEKSWMLEAFFTNSITPMAFLDRKFNFIRVNDAYARADERSPSDFIGRNHFEFYPSDARPIFEEVISTKKTYFAVARPFVYADHPERGVTYWDWTLFPVLDYKGAVDFLVFSLNDVTERVRAEEELKKYREHLEELVRERTEELQQLNEKLLEQSKMLDLAHVFAKDLEDKIIFWGRGMAELYGWPKEDAIGKKTPELLNTVLPKPIGEIRDVLNKKGYWSGELVHQKRDGSKLFVASHWVLHCDQNNNPVAIIEVNNDITELKHTEDVLRETTAYLENLFNYANAPIIAWDSAFKITRFNHAFERLTGFTAQEVIGEELSLLFPMGTREASLGKISKTLTGEYWESVEIPILRKDGEIRIALWNSANIYSEDGATLLATIAQGQDITERKSSEAEIKKLNSELKNSIARLEATNKELEAFSYSVSHDLRVPLRAVDGFARILMEEYYKDLPPEGQHYLQTICESSLQMGKLIDDLLTFSRLGRQDLNKTRVEPADIVRQILTELKSETEGRQINIKTGELPACDADPALLKQVFLNLISNALKFTRKRPVAEIEIGGGLRKNGRPAYFIKDNGVGFDMAYADKLFGVFQRLHKPEEYEGTGVGLAIVKRIVTRHGGEVWAEAETDKGAVFYFTL